MQIALVTGGGGGIGSAVARRLAREGQHVVVADIDLPAATRVAHAVQGTPVRLNAGDFDDNHRLAGWITEHFGQLDVAVLNVGINSGQRGAQPLDPARYRDCVNVNLDSIVFGIDAVTPLMAAGGGGLIMVTCSLSSLWPEVSNPVYTLTKTGALGYVRAMARLLAERGIAIHALCPSSVDTPMMGPSRGRALAQGFPLISPDQVAEAMMTIAETPGAATTWSLVAGQPPMPYEFAPVPPTLRPDGTVVPVN
ncbi:short-chain dehydrogenase [Rhizocola hellebori]|uniref:Short-chain dehydrogenase n=1 Tax=Rhizocola hellebori TaxID=1392758 RepID=A0A8J3Q6Y5_9ACTN|nr:SDR family oxidoreductase [Rhizocola hellebori]GIH04250.1 short-chain dehydrogenase [Rhizocola hellebori]